MHAFFSWEEKWKRKKLSGKAIMVYCVPYTVQYSVPVQKPHLPLFRHRNRNYPFDENKFANIDATFILPYTVAPLTQLDSSNNLKPFEQPIQGLQSYKKFTLLVTFFFVFHSGWSILNILKKSKTKKLRMNGLIIFLMIGTCNNIFNN